MLKKWTSIFLAMVLAMALCPAVAMAENTNNWDMEIWTDPSAPDGFTVTPGAGAVVSCDETSLYGNSSKKMKIVHSENVTTTVTVNIPLGNKNDKSAEYSIYFVLSELAEGDGVKLGTTDNQYFDFETYFFKKTGYEKWRKMMNFYAGSTKTFDMTVTFSGKGTLYLDNAEGKAVDTVINGDLEGLIGDGILAGSEMGKGGETSTMALWTKGTHVAPGVDEPTTSGIYFVETNVNNYFLLVNKTRSQPVSYISAPGPDLEAGKSYRLRIDHKSVGGIGGGVLMDAKGFQFPRSSSGQNYTGQAEDWTEKAFVFVHGFGSSNSRVHFSFVGHWTSGTETKSYFDNLRIEEVVEEAGLINFETGESINNLTNGEKVTVFYKKPLINVENDVYSRTVDDGNGGTTTEYVAAANGYETAKKITVAAALYKKDGAVKTMETIQILEKGGVTVRGNEWGNAQHTLTEIGFLPAHASFDIEIPETGDYEVRLMAWDSMGAMTPAAAQVYTFATASAS